MRAVILAFVSAATLAAVSAQAATPPPKPSAIQLGAEPFLELVRDGCGRGWHRHHWRDQWGYWRGGDCVPDGGGPYHGNGAGTYYPPSYWGGPPPRPRGW
jgi:hypothetical protein